MHKKEIKKENKKFVITVVLISAVICIGFSVVTYPIANKVNLKTSSWNISFTNVSLDNIIGTASEIQPPLYDATYATFNVALQSPGDEISYDFTITNLGTLNAKIDGIYVVPENSSDNPILYNVTGINVGDVLDSNQSTHMKVTATLDKNYNGPGNISKQVKVIINYVQK